MYKQLENSPFNNEIINKLIQFIILENGYTGSLHNLDILIQKINKEIPKIKENISGLNDYDILKSNSYSKLSEQKTFLNSGLYSSEQEYRNIINKIFKINQLQEELNRLSMRPFEKR